jgi:DNA repair protein RecO (recombination protein O)
MFLNEVLNKCVRDESHADEVFEFMYHALLTLDKMEVGVESFHIVFLLKLSKYLGFEPQNLNELLGHKMVDVETEKILNEFIGCNFDSAPTLTLNKRREVLECILKFYGEHIESFGEVKSVQILREVLS